MTIEKKILDRFQHLIDLDAELTKSRKQGGGDVYNPPYDYVDKEKATQWGISCLHILPQVFGDKSDQYVRFNEEFPKLSHNTNYYVVKRALGILKAAKDDFESGFLFDTHVLIQAEVFEDFLEQAEHLLKKGYFGPAAVVAGS